MTKTISHNHNIPGNKQSVYPAISTHKSARKSNKTYEDLPEIQVGLKLKTYKPKFFDLFGYDLSGQRKRLITEIIKYFEFSANNDKDVKQYIPALKHSLVKSRVKQDIELGIFLNLLIEKGYKFENIHKSLHKLIAAGKPHFIDKKNNFELTEFLCAEEEKLLNHLLPILSDYKNVNQKLKSTINRWLKNKRSKLSKISSHTNKPFLESKYCEIYARILNLVYKGKHFKEKSLPSSIAINFNLSPLQLGELLEDICTRIAQLKSSNNFNDFYEARSRAVQTLTNKLKSIHEMFIHHNTEQINAQRILNLLASYKRNIDLDLISASLLQLLHDEIIYINFKKELDKLITYHNDFCSWKQPFPMLIKTSDFNNFITHMINLAGYNAKESKLFHTILDALIEHSNARKYH